MNPSDFFQRELSCQILSTSTETLTDRKTGEIVTYHRIYYVANEAGRKVAGELTCGPRALPKEGLSDGGDYVIVCRPFSRNNRVTLQVASVRAAGSRSSAKAV